MLEIKMFSHYVFKNSILVYLSFQQQPQPPVQQQQLLHHGVHLHVFVQALRRAPNGKPIRLTEWPWRSALAAAISLRLLNIIPAYLEQVVIENCQVTIPFIHLQALRSLSTRKILLVGLHQRWYPMLILINGMLIGWECITKLCDAHLTQIATLPSKY